MSEDLFGQSSVGVIQPLAARLRPTSLDDYVGQAHILGLDKPLRILLDKGLLHSMVLWGPPGTGKTTLAKLLSHHINARFVSLSAVLAGVKDIRAAVGDAQMERQRTGRNTVLFIDEVHRFNKSQQDAFLPYVEDGTVVFVGATTENPSFEVNNALLSRCRVYVLKSLDSAALTAIARRALADTVQGLGQRQLQISDPALNKLVTAADGDARRLLNLLEIASDFVEDGGLLDESQLLEVFAGDARRFDKGGDLFYEQISALHKSVRGTSPDAALYWFVRMLDGGCDPLYIARRVVRMASEDIGNADPRGLALALNAWDVQERLGSPEGELAIAQAIGYLAAAPKSNAIYKALHAAWDDVKSMPGYDVPLHLRNAPTTVMKNLDYGKDYRYAHDEPDGYAAGVSYFPQEIPNRIYYEPVNRGLEIQIADKLNRLRERDKAAPSGGTGQ